MPDDTKERPQQPEPKSRPPSPPLVFISHDSRDAEIAEAFSTLLRRVTAGLLKSFRSSDKKGTEGIEFGDEWYKRLMSMLESASDVVCLFTERSLERPWILYEAGVAKGKLDRPVLGIALGVPLSRVGTGPFYQFQNCDDSEDSLVGLVMQLARRIPSVEPDPDIVQAQVQAFKATVDAILAQLREPGETEEEAPTEASTAKVLEELKLIVRELPSRVERQLSDSEMPSRRRLRCLHPMLFDEIMHMMPQGPEDPLAILVFTSFFRDEIPWLYELGREAYDAFQSRSEPRRERALVALRRAMDTIFHSPVGHELLADSEEGYMIFKEYARFMERAMEKLVEGSEEP